MLKIITAYVHQIVPAKDVQYGTMYLNGTYSFIIFDCPCRISEIKEAWIL